MLRDGGDSLWYLTAEQLSPCFRERSPLTNGLVWLFPTSPHTVGEMNAGWHLGVTCAHPINRSSMKCAYCKRRIFGIEDRKDLGELIFCNGLCQQRYLAPRFSLQTFREKQGGDYERADMESEGRTGESHQSP